MQETEDLLTEYRKRYPRLNNGDTEGKRVMNVEPIVDVNKPSTVQHNLKSRINQHTPKNYEWKEIKPAIFPKYKRNYGSVDPEDNNMKYSSLKFTGGHSDVQNYSCLNSYKRYSSKDRPVYKIINAKVVRFELGDEGYEEIKSSYQGGKGKEETLKDEKKSVEDFNYYVFSENSPKHEKMSMSISKEIYSPIGGRKNTVKRINKNPKTIIQEFQNNQQYQPSGQKLSTFHSRRNPEKIENKRQVQNKEDQKHKVNRYKNVKDGYKQQKKYCEST